MVFMCECIVCDVTGGTWYAHPTDCPQYTPALRWHNESRDAPAEELRFVSALNRERMVNVDDALGGRASVDDYLPPLDPRARPPVYRHSGTNYPPLRPLPFVCPVRLARVMQLLKSIDIHISQTHTVWVLFSTNPVTGAVIPPWRDQLLFSIVSVPPSPPPPTSTMAPRAPTAKVAPRSAPHHPPDQQAAAQRQVPSQYQAVRREARLSLLRAKARYSSDEAE